MNDVMWERKLGGELKSQRENKGRKIVSARKEACHHKISLVLSKPF